jgi:hypothetical protein
MSENKGKFVTDVTLHPLQTRLRKRPFAQPIFTDCSKLHGLP